MASKYLVIIGLFLGFISCKTDTARNPKNQVTITDFKSDMDKNIQKYVSVKLTSDVSKLSVNQKKMLPILIKAADMMNDLFWQEAYGDKSKLLKAIKDSATREFVSINYGPWDRLGDNKPFIDGVGEKPAGANFYPQDMGKNEFEEFDSKTKTDLYTFIRRHEDTGELYTVPYHEMFSKEVKQVAGLLNEAAKLADNAGLKKYLYLRAKALLDDDYFKSDMAWMDMKTNQLDIVIGPIETYEDKLFGYKAAHEGYVLIKDMDWSKKLAKFISFLPELQANLPVEAKYKQEKPAAKSDLNAYDVVYYAGDCNSGGKTIAINLPNDEKVQLQKGSRRLQLKNAMRAKFDKILVPIAKELIAEDQQQYITFDAFFANTMFHEVAHGLGIKNTINGKGTVREALKKYYSALEEGKADILGLYMVQQLHNKGELGGDMKDYMTTFLASIFRSVRFGAADAHGIANMVRFNFFKEKGAFTRNADNSYSVNYDKMNVAMKDLSQLILSLQGEGDFSTVEKLVQQKGIIDAQLQADLDRLTKANIPVDVIFEQGVDVLGLKE
jgi:peptidase M49-like protein